MRTNACQTCAKAKRRCDRQRPKCARCCRQGIQCTYPPARQSSFVLSGEDNNELAYRNASALKSLSDFHSTLLPPPDLDDPLEGVTNDTGAQSSPPPRLLISAMTPWNPGFTSSALGRVANDQLRSYVLSIRGWLTEWVEKGSNPFIHSFLYRTKMPVCIQDAYTTLSSYLHKTASNEQVVFHILEDRIQQLIATKGMPSAEVSHISGGGSENENEQETRRHGLNSIEYLARVQALLVYQFIALFDGDIRLRHFSESQLPLLHNWARELLDYTARIESRGGLVDLDSLQEVAADSNENLNWHCWIIAESIQRTCIVAMGIGYIYSMIQQDKASPCPGLTIFTTRSGIWEAQSALAWSKLCLESNTGSLMQLSEVDRLFAEATPEEVNDFTKVLLEATYGSDRMEIWTAEKRVSNHDSL